MRYGKLTLAFLLLGGSLPHAAQAQFVFPDRTSFFDVTFSNNDFSNANAFYQVTQGAYSTAGSATAPGYGINLKSDHSGFGWTGYGGTTVPNIAEIPNFATADLTSTGAVGGYVFSYNTPEETAFNNNGGSFGNTWIVRRDFSGLIGLEFQGGGTGLLDATGSFTLDVLINGDWSNQGTGPLQTEFVGLNPAWTTDTNFVFNGTNTEFRAHISPYNSQDPGLDFILHGTAVVTPEPSILAFFATSALTGAAFLRRRKQANHAA